MPKYKKKPIVVDAIKWTGNNFFEILKLANGDDSKIEGELYPIKNDIFLETYEKER